jgi:hypothetical protein
MTFNSILKELKNIPSDRLEELYQYIHSLNPKKKGSEQLRKKILTFAGAFSDMSKEDYKDFLKQTKRTRAKLFNRNVDL